MNEFIRILSKKERHIIGVMSGTSLDGIDIALVKCTGSGMDVTLEPLSFKSYPMSSAWRQRIQNAFDASTEEICRINYDLGRLFADTILTFCSDTQLSTNQLDAIGLHGQTLFHIHNHSTLQSGEAEVVAQACRCPVISDFRSADIAAGGSGAPLVPYLDQVLFRRESENIALQNLGGIGNISYLPGDLHKPVLAFDTGPANAILNEAVELLTAGKASFDKDGYYSGQGTVNQELLKRLLNHDYFNKPPPKSTGREEFGKPYVHSIIKTDPGIALPDLIRTFVALIAHTIHISCKRFLESIDLLYVSGGGAHHPLIMADLKSLFGNDTVHTVDSSTGITPDSKEAVAFALLAHERLNFVPTNIPSVTGARHQALLGKLTIPIDLGR